MSGVYVGARHELRAREWDERGRGWTGCECHERVSVSDVSGSGMSVSVGDGSASGMGVSVGDARASDMSVNRRSASVSDMSVSDVTCA